MGRLTIQMHIKAEACTQACIQACPHVHARHTGWTAYPRSVRGSATRAVRSVGCPTQLACRHPKVWPRLLAEGAACAPQAQLVGWRPGSRRPASRPPGPSASRPPAVSSVLPLPASAGCRRQTSPHAPSGASQRTHICGARNGLGGPAGARGAGTGLRGFGADDAVEFLALKAPRQVLAGDGWKAMGYETSLWLHLGYHSRPQMLEHAEGRCSNNFRPPARHWLVPAESDEEVVSVS